MGCFGGSRQMNFASCKYPQVIMIQRKLIINNLQRTHQDILLKDSSSTLFKVLSSCAEGYLWLMFVCLLAGR